MYFSKHRILGKKYESIAEGKRPMQAKNQTKPYSEEKSFTKKKRKLDNLTFKREADTKYDKLLCIHHSNWESEVPCMLSGENMPPSMGAINMKDYFNFPIYSLENDFFGDIWFKRNGICEELEFYPNQIEYLSPVIRLSKLNILEIVTSKVQIGTIPKSSRIDSIDKINEVALNIYQYIFENDKKWLTRVTRPRKEMVSLRSRSLLTPSVGKWYEFIKSKKLWDKREFWTCKMWVVWLVMHILQNLIKTRIIEERRNINNSVTKNNSDINTDNEIALSLDTNNTDESSS